MSDLFENHIVGFPMRRLNWSTLCFCRNKGSPGDTQEIPHFLVSFDIDNVIFNDIFNRIVVKM